VKLIVSTILGFILITSSFDVFAESPSSSVDYFSNPDFQIHKLQEGHYEYSIPYKISQGKITEGTVNCNSNSFLFHVDSKKEDQMSINIPAFLLGHPEYYEFLFIDGEESDYDSISHSNSRTLITSLPAGASEIEIIYSNVGRSTEPLFCLVASFESEYYQILRPLQQLDNGIMLKDVICKEGLELIFKKSGNPVCVKSTSKEILIDRGWTSTMKLIPETEDLISDELFTQTRQIVAKDLILSRESFVMDGHNPNITITLSDINGQDAIVFEGFGFRGFHLIEIIISGEDLEMKLHTQTSEGGNLLIPWIIPDSLEPGTYKVILSDGESLNELKINLEHLGNGLKKISLPQEKTILKLHDRKAILHNGGQPIVFSGRLDTKSGEPISDAEILIKSDGPCPDDGIIAKGTTDKYGKYSIRTLTKIWDPSDNSIKIHAEFLGDERLFPSKSQIEVVVVFQSHAEKCES
jgi:hypothetical protein